MENIVRHPINISRTPIVNGELKIGGVFPQPIKE